MTVEDERYAIEILNCVAAQAIFANATQKRTLSSLEIEQLGFSIGLLVNAENAKEFLELFSKSFWQASQF